MTRCKRSREGQGYSLTVVTHRRRAILTADIGRSSLRHLKSANYILQVYNAQGASFLSLRDPAVIGRATLPYSYHGTNPVPAATNRFANA